MERLSQARMKLENLRSKQTELEKDFDSIEAEIRVDSVNRMYQGSLEYMQTIDRLMKRNQSQGRINLLLHERAVTAAHLRSLEDEMALRMQKVKDLREKCE